MGDPVRLLILVALSLPIFGQRIEVGVKGGVPVTAAFQTGSLFNIDFGESASSATRRYTVGPMVELNLPHVSVLSSTCSITVWDSLISQKP
jgi:hypothetical protein